ncbi:MAG: TatD family hydrolase [Rubrivivax sp.]|jgi:TatD DNase family protein
MFIDSHCHLSFPGLHERLDSVLADMQQAQVHEALCISTTLEEVPTVMGLAQQHPQLWASVGVHPDTEGETEPTVAQLCDWALDPRVVAIGETGLDYYRLNGRSIADMAWQRERFRVHIRAARQTGLPLVIHTRQASEDTLQVVADEGQGAVGGVFHCFTETQAVAEAALAMGFYISFSGILTFKTAQDLRDVAKNVPLDRCLIETDSPYLAPVPYRGKTNTPAYVPHVAACLADIKGLSVEDVAAATRQNFRRLFARTAATAAAGG